MNNLLIAAVAVGVAYLVWQELETQKNKKAAAAVGAGMKEQLDKLYPEEKEKFRSDVEPALFFGGPEGWVKKYDIKGVTYSPQSIEWEIVSGGRP